MDSEKLRNALQMETEIRFIENSLEDIIDCDNANQTAYLLKNRIEAGFRSGVNNELFKEVTFQMRELYVKRFQERLSVVKQQFKDL